MIKQMSIMIITHFFGYEEHDDENNIILGPKKTKYLTIICTSECQKFIYKEILKKINKNINRNYIKIKFEFNDNIPSKYLYFNSCC